MNRRAFIVTTAAAVTVPLGAQAQQAASHRRIAIISAGSVRIALNDVFEEALRNLGWIEGKNIKIDFRLARLDQRGRAADIAALAVEVAADGAEVVVTYANPLTQVVKNTVPNIPIVFAFVADPVEAGLVTSLARPGGNVTGVTHVARDLQAKRLELLKEAIPTISRVGVLVNPAGPLSGALISETQRAAQFLGIELQIEEARGREDFEHTFSAFARERVHGVFIMPDVLFFFHRRRLAELAAQHRLPDVHHEPDTGSRAFMAYGESLEDHMRRQAHYVDKILRGAEPNELPVEQPTNFQLVINLKTARALGLTIPPSLLLRADKVIE